MALLIKPMFRLVPLVFFRASAIDITQQEGFFHVSVRAPLVQINMHVQYKRNLSSPPFLL